MANNDSTASSYLVDQYGRALYASPREQPAKYRKRKSVPREPRKAIDEYAHSELVELSMQLAARVPALRGAVRQKSEWAFAGDSWKPIYYGAHETWGDIATEWLTRQVYPNAIRGNIRTDLIKALQVSGMGWDIHGDDLALFSLGADNMPKMTVIPGSRIGNGPSGYYSDYIKSGSNSISRRDGYSIARNGRYDGAKIYNGIIYNEADEPVAVRVLGYDANGGDKVAEFDLGMARGAHLASDYEWHGMGRPLPRLASSVIPWLDKEELDDLFHKGVKLAATKTVIHKLGEGMDAAMARGNASMPVIIPADQSASGKEETIYVENVAGGDVTYISSGEDLAGLVYQNPHPNVEDFAVRRMRECLSDYGWVYELLDLSSSGRAPTRLACDLVNNSIWQKQTIGETRLEWFIRYAIGVGIRYKHIPTPPDGPLDEPYKWTFGYPGEMTVDRGNDVKAMLDMLRYGLTSQRVSCAKWGYVLERIRKDRQKEAMAIIEDAAALKAAATKKGLNLPDAFYVQMFYSPSTNIAVSNNNNNTPDTPPEPKPATAPMNKK